MIHGPVPLWIICGVALAAVVVALAVHARPSNHERSVRRYRGEMWE